MIETLSDLVIKETHRMEEDVLHTEKNHFASENIWKNRYYGLGLTTTILAAIAGALALYVFENHTTISGFFAIIVAILSGVLTFLNPNERANQYKDVGAKYNVLRNDIRYFREIEIKQILSDDEINKKLNSLRDRKKELIPQTLHISKKARKIAKEGIENGDSEYKIDKCK